MASDVIFAQQIKYDRSKGFCGEYYVGMKPVLRAVMVIRSYQESSIMVQQGKPYVAFITGNTMFVSKGDEMPVNHFFATPEEAVEFVRGELEHHILVDTGAGVNKTF